MKRRLFRLEDLLIIIPLLLFFIEKISGKDLPLDIHLHDTYFVIDSTTIFSAVFFFMAILYLFHVVLRATGKWNGVFSKLHIYGSVFLYLVIILFSRWISYSGLAGAPRRYYDVSDGSAWETFLEFSNTISPITIAFILFLLLQLIFTVYFIIKLFKKAK